LAWTSVGGELLNLEASCVPGKGAVMRTGSLGDVMKESIQAAMTVVRGRAQSLGILPNFHETRDIHIHVPEGATPKDGPSAGITIASALLSLARSEKLARPLAMTGEMTLTGEVFPVGGIREKVIAARRSGIKELIIPKDNQGDYEDVPEHITKGIKVHFVASFDEVVPLLFRKSRKRK
jgi:ATP-dependent Lon protease